MIRCERLINPETGEFIENAVVLEQGEKIISREQSEAYRKIKKREERRGRQPAFSFSNLEGISKAASILTTTQCGYLLRLQCNLDYNGKVVKPDKTPMSRPNMMRELQLGDKESTFRNFFHACVKADIILKNDDGSYSINSAYHFRGTTQNQHVVKSYTATLKRVYKETNASDLGLIYRMLPFVHFSTNMLCENPSEPVPESIRSFNGKRLAERIGVSPQNISRRLMKMMFGDEYVLARVTVGGVSSYMLNPSVFYRGSDYPDDTLRAMFAKKK